MNLLKNYFIFLEKEKILVNTDRYFYFSNRGILVLTQGSAVAPFIYTIFKNIFSNMVKILGIFSFLSR